MRLYPKSGAQNIPVDVYVTTTRIKDFI